MFSCDPNCSFSELGLLEWLFILGFGLSVMILVTLFRKWAFRPRDASPTSLSWHLPKLVFIAVILFLVTAPMVWAAFGHLGLKLYGVFVFPTAVFVIYMALPDDLENEKQR